MDAIVKREFLFEAKRALPYALVLGLLLGGIVGAGAHQSTAMPSEAAPFGWPGVANFDSGVAMVRHDVVLAASVPALLLGALALRRTERPWTAFGAHALALTGGAFVAGAFGAALADDTPWSTFLAFSVSHALLALAFYALAALASVVVPRWRLPLAAGVWLYFVGIHDGIFRTMLFRSAGYHALSAGEIPTWYYATQALSPLSAYKATLILWEPGFMDFVERAALGQATLPAWATPLTFVSLMLTVWVALPLGLASFALWWRARQSASMATRRAPEDAA